MPSANKLQRWTDLLAALLRRSAAVDFDALRREVPAYADASRARDALMRMFERDKDELRSLGVPIESVKDEEGNLSRYRLASKQFYLPYLQLVADAGRPPRRPRGPGYQSLPVLAFEPDELDAVARAAHRVASLGDAALAHEAMSALRKLGHDLRVPDAPDGHELVQLEQPADADTLDRLADALRRRKRVRFTYRSMHRDERSARHVEPYGLAFITGHWYLVGRDVDAEARRQFRVSRMSDVSVNTAKAQSADFTVPEDFDLGAHARSRQAWELGDAEPMEVVVSFHVESGVTRPAMQLGEPVDGDATARRFRVRRPDTFALWLLGFAGDARVDSPPAMDARLRELVQATRARYPEVAT
jgi:predicted DNA-binding transcriptional regulator YafY